MKTKFIKMRPIGFISLLMFISCNDYQKQIDDLESQISQISAQNLQSKITQLENEISKTSDEGKLQDLQNKITQLENDIKTLPNSSDISKLQIEVNDLKRQLGIVQDEADLEKPAYEISDFVWRAMNFFYYWQGDVDLLANSVGENRNQYIKLIKENSNAEDFFQALRHDDDRFSWFIDDYIEQEKSFQGISKDHGMQFRLSYINRDVNLDLFGFVQLVHKGSNAEKQGVQRGMLFTHINDQALNFNNYMNLTDGDSFTITVANYDTEKQEFKNTDTKITLTKEEDFVKNPIVFNDIIERGGQKIGYLFYNQFVFNNQRNRQLNDIFGDFKTKNITDLIVDLRYNSGGSSAISNFIASAISGKGSDDIISKSFWNRNVLNRWFDGADGEIEYFYDDVPLRDSEMSISINKLDLERVYFITTERSASASEQLINNLKPHMEVIQVGEKTVGKNDGSFTLYDMEDIHPSGYWRRQNGTVNPNHKNAIQPLVVKSGNSEGFYQFENGLEPNYEISERILNLGTIGNTSEPLLARVLQLIAPISSRDFENEFNDIEFKIFSRPEDQTGILIYDLDMPFSKQE